MRSLQAFTNEVDDIDLAVSELKAGIDTSLFMKNTCGIIFCGFEPDMEALVPALKEAFDFPFFGCTGVGILSTHGCSQNSISLLVADKNAEGRAYEGRLPENINVQGVYIYGEFCPAHGKHNDGLYNVLSNETFTILAI